MITFEIEIILMLCPVTIAASLMTTGIAGKGTQPQPLHSVETTVEQIG